MKEILEKAWMIHKAHHQLESAVCHELRFSQRTCDEFDLMRSMINSYPHDKINKFIGDFRQRILDFAIRTAQQQIKSESLAYVIAECDMEQSAIDVFRFYNFPDEVTEVITAEEERNNIAELRDAVRTEFSKYGINVKLLFEGIEEEIYDENITND